MAPLDLLMTADTVGGVWTYAVELGGALVARGHRVTLAVTGPAPSSAQRDEAATAGLTLLPDILPLDWLCAGPEPVQAGAERLAALAADHDVLLLNSPALAARARFAVPVIAVAHGDVGTWWEAARPGTPLDPAYDWLTALIGEGLRGADRVVAPTAAHGAAVRAFYGVEQVEAVWNGRSSFPSSFPRTRETSASYGEAERAGPAELGSRVRSNDKVVVHALTVGRLWDDAKDLATLNAAAVLTARPIHAAGTLDGPNGERADVANLRTLGAVAPDHLAALLAARPVFVSTAVYEPFGLAVLEAAQAGCPLVLSDIPSLRELWDGAATFVPPRDVAGFARALDAPSISGEAAQRRAAHYTVDAMADGMEALIRDALRQPVAA